MKNTRLLNRIIAFFIDMMLIGLILLPFVFLSQFFNIGNTIFIPVLLFSIAYTVLICKDLFYSGRSIGKYIMQLDILDKKNNTPSIVKLVFRNILIFIWPLGFLVCLINPEKKLEDRLLGTRVIPFEERERRALKKINILIILAVVLFLNFIIFYSILEWFYINNDLLRLLYSA